MTKLILYFAAFFILFSSCATRYAQRTSENPLCPTKISGALHVNESWPWKCPAILIKDNRGDTLLYGSIKGKFSDGYIFQPAKGNFFENSIYINYEEIIFLVNENGKIIYGKLPGYFTNMRGLDIYLEAIGKSKNSKIITLDANEEFSYCMEPGQYYIDKIEFKRNDLPGYIDVSTEIPYIQIELLPGTNTYLGDIYTDPPEENRDALVIHSRIKPLPDPNDDPFPLSRDAESAEGWLALLVADIIVNAVKYSAIGDTTHRLMIVDECRIDSAKIQLLKY